MAFVGDLEKGLGKMFVANNQGKEATTLIASAKYDPKYGITTTYEAMSDEQRKVQEDMMAGNPPAITANFKIVGIVEAWKTKE